MGIESRGKSSSRRHFVTNDEQILCNSLCHFFTEVIKGDGSHYCPRSLSSMLAGLQRHIENVSPRGARIQNREGHFKPLHTLLENVYKNLHKQGVGTSTVQSEIVTHNEEKQLWECGALGVHSPESLLNAVFYYNGLNLHCEEEMSTETSHFPK